MIRRPKPGATRMSLSATFSRHRAVVAEHDAVHHVVGGDREQVFERVEPFEVAAHANPMLDRRCAAEVEAAHRRVAAGKVAVVHRRVVAGETQAAWSSSARAGPNGPAARTSVRIAEGRARAWIDEAADHLLERQLPRNGPSVARNALSRVSLATVARNPCSTLPPSTSSNSGTSLRMLRMFTFSPR